MCEKLSYQNINTSAVNQAAFCYHYKFTKIIIEKKTFTALKSVQIRGYFWPVFPCIRTEYGPEIIPYLDTFHAVISVEGSKQGRDTIF